MGVWEYAGSDGERGKGKGKWCGVGGKERVVAPGSRSKQSCLRIGARESWIVDRPFQARRGVCLMSSRR